MRCHSFNKFKFMWKHKMKCNTMVKGKKNLWKAFAAPLESVVTWIKKSLVSLFLFFFFQWIIFCVCFISKSYIFSENVFGVMKQREIHWFISCLRMHRVVDCWCCFWVWHQFAAAFCSHLYNELHHIFFPSPYLFVNSVIYYYLTNRIAKIIAIYFSKNVINCAANIKCAPFKRIIFRRFQE